MFVRLRVLCRKRFACAAPASTSVACREEDSNDALASTSVDYFNLGKIEDSVSFHFAGGEGDSNDVLVTTPVDYSTMGKIEDFASTPIAGGEGDSNDVLASAPRDYSNSSKIADSASTSIADGEGDSNDALASTPRDYSNFSKTARSASIPTAERERDSNDVLATTAVDYSKFGKIEDSDCDSDESTSSRKFSEILENPMLMDLLMNCNVSSEKIVQVTCREPELESQAEADKTPMRTMIDVLQDVTMKPREALVGETVLLDSIEAPSHQKFNGRLAIVGDFVAEKDRFLVHVCGCKFMVKPEKIRLCCGGAPVEYPKEGASTVSSGCVAKLVGLTSATHKYLNGQIVIVGKFEPSKQRYSVHVVGTKILVKEQNLQEVSMGSRTESPIGQNVWFATQLHSISMQDSLLSLTMQACSPYIAPFEELLQEHVLIWGLDGDMSCVEKEKLAERLLSMPDMQPAATSAAAHVLREVDNKRAQQVYRQAIAKGSSIAPEKLIHTYTEEWPPSPSLSATVRQRMIECLRLGALRGNVNAMHKLAFLLESGDVNDCMEARRWYKKAGEMGAGLSLGNLGIILRDEDGATMEKVFPLFEKAMALGYSQSRVIVAREWLESGETSSICIDAIESWLQDAVADKQYGSWDALVHLALLYSTTRYGKLNMNWAAALVRRAESMNPGCSQWLQQVSCFANGSAWEQLPFLVEARERLQKKQVLTLVAALDRCDQAVVRKCEIMALLNTIIPRHQRHSITAEVQIPEGITQALRRQLMLCATDPGADYFLNNSSNQFGTTFVRVIFHALQIGASHGDRASLARMYDVLKPLAAKRGMTVAQLKEQLTHEYGADPTEELTKVPAGSYEDFFVDGVRKVIQLHFAEMAAGDHGFNAEADVHDVVSGSCEGPKGAVYREMQLHPLKTHLQILEKVKVQFPNTTLDQVDKWRNSFHQKVLEFTMLRRMQSMVWNSQNPAILKPKFASYIGSADFQRAYSERRDESRWRFARQEFKDAQAKASSEPCVEVFIELGVRHMRAMGTLLDFRKASEYFKVAKRLDVSRRYVSVLRSLKSLLPHPDRWDEHPLRKAQFSSEAWLAFCDEASLLKEKQRELETFKQWIGLVHTYGFSISVAIDPEKLDLPCVSLDMFVQFLGLPKWHGDMPGMTWDGKRLPHQRRPNQICARCGLRAPKMSKCHICWLHYCSRSCQEQGDADHMPQCKMMFASYNLPDFCFEEALSLMRVRAESHRT